MCVRVFFPGEVPGAAEQDAGDQVEAAAGADHGRLQHRAHDEGLHRQPAEAAGHGRQRQEPPGPGEPQHAQECGGLQE